MGRISAPSADITPKIGVHQHFDFHRLLRFPDSILWAFLLPGSGIPGGFLWELSGPGVSRGRFARRKG